MYAGAEGPEELTSMMLRDPALIPPVRGVYALVNKKRRFAYVGYSQNLQKRSHSMSHMLMNYDRDKRSYWPIKDLPKHPSDEYVFVMFVRNCASKNALAGIAAVEKGFASKNYTL